jgi:hypothetical protein
MYRKNPRRRLHKIGRHVELVIAGGRIVHRRVYTGSEWIVLQKSANLEMVLFKQIQRLKAKIREMMKETRIVPHRYEDDRETTRSPSSTHRKTQKTHPVKKGGSTKARSKRAQKPTRG